jgi:hypothetical protein
VKSSVALAANKPTLDLKSNSGMVSIPCGKVTVMAMSNQEKKAAQRSRPEGYAKSRESDWKRRGITDISYQKYLVKLEVQHHMCAICGAHINGNSSLDHDHANGNPRGLLCNDCNLALGHIEAGGSQFLANASAYLLAWGS